MIFSNIEEISNNQHACELVWSWYARRPGFDTGEWLLGDDWWHYLFYVDGVPQVCVSINERRPMGYEIHVAAAKKTNPNHTRAAIRFVGDRLTTHPLVRLASWCPANHRAAVRLNREFLTEEIRTEVVGQEWIRFGASAREWWDRHGHDGVGVQVEQQVLYIN